MADDPQSDFLQTYGGLAQDISGRTGLDPSVVLGQIAQETGWGQHVQGNNIFGISPGGQVKNYPTVQDAASDYVNLINSRYPNATKSSDPSVQAQVIGASGYNPSPDYGAKVAGLAQSIRARGPNATLSDSDLDKALLTPPSPAQPPQSQQPAGATAAIPDDQLDAALLGKNAPDLGRPSTDFRYVAPYTAPDGGITTIAPEDYARFQALIKYDQAHPAPVPAPGSIDPVTHQPVQIAGTATPSPVTSFMDQGAPVSGASSPTASALGSLPTDPAQRARILASHFYPNMPLNQAMAHLTPGPNGGMIVLGDNGRPIYEDPATPSLSSLTSLRPGNLLAWGASAAGPALPVVGGALGSVASAPTSLVAGPAFAAGGAAAGDLIRQGAAKFFDPTPAATPIDLGQTATQAAWAAGNQLLGAAGANILAPNTLRMTPQDLNSLRGPSVMSNAQNAYDRAGSQGVQLTPGQATGLPSLLQYEDAAKTLPGTSDPAEAFYRRQGLQLSDAGQNLLNTISPNADKTDAALQFQQGASDAVRGVRQAANEKARDAYSRANSNAMPPPSPGQVRPILDPASAPSTSSFTASPNKVFPTLAPDRFKPYDLLGTPDGLGAYNAARVSAANDGIRLPSVAEVEGGATIPFQGWDYMKKVLQGQASEAARAGNNYRATQMTDLANGIKNEVVKVNPAYGEALDLVAPGQRLASRLDQSGIGTVADQIGDERARAILAPVFNQNPRAISEARDAFINSGRSDEWYAGVRAHIQDAFDKASMSQQGLNPAMLRRQVWGNVDNREAIQAALTPTQYEGFDRFMQTVEDTARTYPMNSLTATRQAAQNSLRSAAENQSNVKLIDAIGSAFSPASYATVGTRLLAGVRGRAVEGNVRNIVSSLFDPNGLKYLEEMANYSPKSLKAGNLAAQILGRAVPPLTASSANDDTNPLQASRAGR